MLQQPRFVFPPRLAVAAGVALLLSACSADGPRADAGATAAAPDAVCDARPAQSAIGQMATAALVEAARQQSGARIARVLRPGQLITKEFNTQRLDLELDGADRVVAVRCG